MFLLRRFEIPQTRCLHHVCGDVPQFSRPILNQAQSSPRMWGCSSYRQRLLLVCFVFPTHVGMFPSRSRRRIRSNSLPHACGDVPVPVHALVKAGVFPTLVGMFLTVSFLSRFAMSLPHACGDVPTGAFVSDVHPCLPHASGDVPTLLKLCLHHACCGFQKSKISLFCLRLESACYISAFNEPILVGSLSNRLCVVPSEFQFTGQGMGAMVARHISALFVNLTFHLRRNHHVRRICSRSQFCYFFSRR